MTMSIEKYVSNLVKNQFPAFYHEEGPNFVLFMEAYYEWLEETGNPIAQARRISDYRDIDTTMEQFLAYFQRKYLYGIPFQIISNKRLLLKHILDIYRSKGTIRCYELLFKLIYDQDIEVYLPSYDMLRVSDGTWVEPKFLEITDSPVLNNIRGKQIVGTVSNTVAIVEKYVHEPINNNISASLYISNIMPKGGTFVIGEKLLNYQNTASYTLDEAPVVTGSMATLQIISGGDDFNVGDILAVADKDINTGAQGSFGVGGKFKVTKTSRSQGTLEFFIAQNGFGITPNTSIYFYKSTGDNSGYGASFKLAPLSFVRRLTYNTDLIIDYRDTPINASVYDMPLNYSANVSYALNQSLSFSNNNFGSVYALTDIAPGNNYIYAPHISMRSSLRSKPLPGSVAYSNSSPFVLTLGGIAYDNTSTTVTGTGTSFTSMFTSGSVIGLQSANNAGVEEYKVIASVVSDTSLVLESPPDYNSTSYARYYKIPSVVGTGTTFTEIFSNNDIIGLQSTTGAASTLEFHAIKQVVNNTLLIMYDAPKNYATSGSYYLAPSIMRSQFALYEPVMYQANGTVPGENSIVSALPNNGNNIVSEVVAYDSGKGYVQGETVKCYTFNILTTPQIVKGGTGYTNGQLLTFTGGSSSTQANGFVTTNTSGGIVGINLVNPGANYTDVPIIGVTGPNGNGAVLTTTIAAPNNYNTYSVVIGKVQKAGVGVSPGYWSTTRGFLNSDKYIQDSYFYQDYSYQIKVANVLDNYKQIIYNTFHTAGMELFGSYLSMDNKASKSSILFEVNKPIFEKFLTADSTMTVDTTYFTSDIYWYPARSDEETRITADDALLTADATYLYY